MNFQFRKKWHLWVLSLIVLLALFVRSYNFSDWLYFESDQARNVNGIIEVAEKGLGSLPLLGPKAGGTDLHLGPAWSYVEYLAAAITGNTKPYVAALPNLFFSLLMIPLFYYFLSQFFSRKVSLLTTGLIAFNFVFTQYSRFSWNPNTIPFWSLIFFLGVYRAHSEFDRKKAGFWLISAAASYGIVSQLHFIAFLGLPVVAIVFWTFYCPSKILPRFWIGAIAVLFLLYLPVIVSDIHTDGNNTQHFLYSLSNRSEKRGLMETASKAIEMHGKYYSLILTSFYEKEFKPIGGIGVLFTFASLVFLVLTWMGKMRIGEKITRPFLALVFIWFTFYSFLYFRLAYDSNEPRFWFPIAILPFIFLALIFSWLEKKKHGFSFVVVIAIFLLVANLTAVASWFGAMKNQDEDKLLFGRKFSSTTLIQDDFITLEKMIEATAFMKKMAETRGKTVCFSSPSTYLASYQHVFRNVHDDFSAKRLRDVDEEAPENCRIFLIKHSSKERKKLEEHYLKNDTKITLGTRKKFGLIEVWDVREVSRIEKEEDVVDEKGEEETEKEEKKKPQRLPKLTWGDVLGRD